MTVITSPDRLPDYFDIPVSLLELGVHVRSEKLMVACDSESSRRGTVEMTCARYGIPVFPTPGELADAVTDSVYI